jgi:integrase
MRRACERLGLPMLTNHALRHYFASVCIASGVDIPTVSRWLGHAAGGALAMKTYGHLLKDASQVAAAKVDFTDQTRSVSGC